MVKRAPDRDGGDNKKSGGGFALTETKRGPDYEWSANKRDWIVFGRDRKPSAENSFAQDGEQNEKQDDFAHFPAIQARARSDAPKNKQWSDDQVAGGIAQPPGQPDRTEIGPIGESAEGKTGYSESRADERANRRGQGELENILCTIERARAAGEIVDQPCAAKRFKRVPSRDAK